MSLKNSLLESNIEALQEGAELIRLLEARQFTQGFKPAFQSTIGAHFRHILEHYRCLLSQMSDGAFCYDLRERDQLLECDIEYAARTIDELKQQLSELNDVDFSRQYTITDQQIGGLLQTNLARELLFLQAHTVHHYAIIGAMTRAFGKHPDEDFGVAIATREHQKNCDNENTIGDTPPCAQ